jgi:hypothetical protein
MAKDEDQLRRELLQREKTGQFNSLERKTSGFSDNFSIGGKPLSQLPAIIDKVVVDSKIQNSNQREAVVINEGELNYYDAFLSSLNDEQGRDLKTIQKSQKKILTRNAEGPERAAKAPFYYESTSAEYALFAHIHPSQRFEKNDESKPKVGAVVNQTYQNSEKKEIIITKVEKDGFNPGPDFKIEDPASSPDTSSHFTNYDKPLFAVNPSSPNLPVGTYPSSVSREAIQVGTIIYNNMKGRKGNKACQFLDTWKTKYNQKHKSARTTSANSRYAPAVAAAVSVASAQFTLDVEMMRTFAWIESGYKASAVNKHSNATGIYQILPHLTLDGRRKIYQIHKKDLADPIKNAIAVGRKLKGNIDKIEKDSLVPLGIKRLEPWQVYVTHNQGVDGFAVQHIACNLFSDKGEREELIYAAQYLFDNGYGPVMTNGKNYFPKSKNNS